MILSIEQQHILNEVTTGDNVIVDAVAGTGKTTLILAIAKELTTKRILQITYNKSLKFEVRAKIKEEGYTNLNVHTYHSLAVCYYSSTAHVDNEIKKIIDNDTVPNIAIPIIDILVIDEAQDMTLLYYQLIVKYIKDIGKPVQLIILGDYMQGLYEFKGSDVRFLTHAQEIWEENPYLQSKTFKKCTMKMSYRITNQMCSYVNNVLLGEQRMEACRDDTSVQYIRNSGYNIETIICVEIAKLIGNGANPSEIFILGPSVKRGMVRRLENALVERNIPCHVPMIESTDIDQRVIDGKVVFSTFHSVKGRQRKYVFVLGFDNSYFKYFTKTMEIPKCPNTLYVACTRSTGCLYLLEYNTRVDDRPLDFLKMNHIEMKKQPYINFRGYPQTNFFQITDPETSTKLIKKITPTSLIRFIPEDVNLRICDIINRIFTKENDDANVIELPSIIQTSGGFYEEVSDINGIAIPCLYYDELINFWRDTPITNTKDSILYGIIDMNMENGNYRKRKFITDLIEKLPEHVESIRDYLIMANLNVSIQEALYFKLKQIEYEDYNWLSDIIVGKCKTRMRNAISMDCRNEPPDIEYNIITASDDELHINMDEQIDQYISDTKFRFTARVDLITETTLWEIKCTTNTTTDHLIQLAIYAWIWQHSNRTKKQYKLLNVVTGDTYTMIDNVLLEDLDLIMKELLLSRYSTRKPKTDEEFIQSCVE
jgi:nucleoside-triphosphatase THEP1